MAPSSTIMGHSPSKDEAKEAAPNAAAVDSGSDDAKDRNEETAADLTEIRIRIADERVADEKTLLPPKRTREDVSKERSSTTNSATVFSSSAQETLARARLLALQQQNKDSPNSSLDKTNEQPEISIELLRDLINQNPGEFWQPSSKEASNTTNNRIVFEQSTLPRENGSDADIGDSGNPAKRRKLQQENSSDQPTPLFPVKPKNQVFTAEDRETLQAIQTLLEDSLRELPTTGNLAENLLKELSKRKPTDDESNNNNSNTIPMEIDGDDQPQANDLARRVTRSFAQDLSAVLKAMANAKSFLKDSTQTTPQPLTKPPSKPVESSLLCDEENLVQLKEEGESDGDDDDEIIEISQDENYVQQHLVCHEKDLFGKSSKTKNRENHDDDLLFAQKVALLRETKRLIRSKTLVLTKRRLGIQGDEDSLVI